MDSRAAKLAVEVSHFLMDLSGCPRKPDGGQKAARSSKPLPDAPYPFDDFAYASALSDWERKNKPNRAWFSTEDPFMLHYKVELTLKFGLRVVTREEAQRLDIQQPTIVTKVHEATWLEGLGIVNPFGDPATNNNAD